MKQNKIPRNEYIRKPVGKTNPYKEDTIYTDMGQWKYPGQVTKIPSGDITMQGVPYPVYGQDNLGYSQMMYPGMDYQFPGQYVTEYPQMQIGGLLKKGLKAAKEAVKNTYKINPFALKENPEMYLYRARPVGQNPNMNIAAKLRAKEAAGEPLTPIQRNIMNNSKYKEYNPALYAREKYYGQWFEKDPSRLDWYIDPGRRNFADDDVIEILRTKLPKSEAAKLNVSQFDDAKILSSSPKTEFILPKDMVNTAETFPIGSWQQLIQQDKTFNTPHWLKGYPKKAYGGDPSLPNIEGHYPFGGIHTKTHTHMKEGGWLDQYQDGGWDQNFQRPGPVADNVAPVISTPFTPKISQEFLQQNVKPYSYNPLPIRTFEDFKGRRSTLGADYNDYLDYKTYIDRYKESNLPEILQDAEDSYQGRGKWENSVRSNAFIQDPEISNWLKLSHLDESHVNKTRENQYYIPSGKQIKLTQGRYNLGKIDTGLVDEIVKKAKQYGVDPLDILSVAGRESTFAQPYGKKSRRDSNDLTDIFSAWANSKENASRYRDYFGKKKHPGLSLVKDKSGWSYREDHTNGKSLAKYSQEDVDEYLKYLQEKEKTGPKDNALDFVAKMIKDKKLYKYNPGDPDYQNKLANEKKLLSQEKELMKYLGSNNEESLTTKKMGGWLDKYQGDISGSQVMPSETTQSFIPANLKNKLDQLNKQDPKYKQKLAQEKKFYDDVAKAEEDARKQEVADRKARIADSIEAQKESIIGNPNWREVLARQTQATGDKFRVSDEPNFFDDYINPGVWIGDMASDLGQAPYVAKEMDSNLPYALAIGAPLLTGALEGIGGKSTKDFITNIISPVPFTGSMINKGLDKVKKTAKNIKKATPKSLPKKNIKPTTDVPIPEQKGINPLAVADNLVPRLDPLLFLEDGSLMDMSPLNLISFYGKSLKGKDKAFRKFGNTLEDVIKRKSLSPKGGSKFRMGKDQIVNEGNWAALNRTWEKYPGTYAAEFDFKAPGSNLGFTVPSNRSGVLITDAAGNRLPDIPVSDPGLQFHRRLPFSTRYVPIDKEKLINNEFQLATQGSYLQSLAEKYGYGLGAAASIGLLGGGAEEAVDKYNKYTIDPIINFAKKQYNNVKQTSTKKEGGWLDAYDDEYRRGGQRRRRGTSKNIQSSINDIFRRNYDVFGPAGKSRFNPRARYEEGGDLPEAQLGALLKKGAKAALKTAKATAKVVKPAIIKSETSLSAFKEREKALKEIAEKASLERQKTNIAKYNLGQKQKSLKSYKQETPNAFLSGKKTYPTEPSVQQKTIEEIPYVRPEVSSTEMSVYTRPDFYESMGVPNPNKNRLANSVLKDAEGNIQLLSNEDWVNSIKTGKSNILNYLENPTYANVVEHNQKVANRLKLNQILPIQKEKGLSLYESRLAKIKEPITLNDPRALEKDILFNKSNVGAQYTRGLEGKGSITMPRVFPKEKTIRDTEHEILHHIYPNLGEGYPSFTPLESLKAKSVFKSPAELRVIEEANDVPLWYLDDVDELVPNTFDLAKDLGIQKFQKYPGKESFKSMLENYKGDKPFIKDALKLNNSRDYKRAWDMMTGVRLGLVPGAIGAGYALQEQKMGGWLDKAQDGKEYSNAEANYLNRKAYEESLAQARKDYVNDFVKQGTQDALLNSPFNFIAGLTPAGAGIFAGQSALSSGQNLANKEYFDAGLDALFAGPLLKGAKPAAKKAIKNIYKLNPKAEKLKKATSSYRVAGMDAYDDFKKTGSLRSKTPELPSGASLQERIMGARPTGFPSFQKGYADLRYLPDEGGVIFKTDLPTFKRGEINPVTGSPIKGRHYAHRAIDPKTGATMSNIPGSEVEVFGSTPHWLKGYPKLPKQKMGGWLDKYNNF